MDPIIERMRQLLQDLTAALEDISALREPPPDEWSAPPDGGSDPGVVYFRLTHAPWGFGGEKARRIVMRGVSESDLDEWERFAHARGRPAAATMIQQYRHPRDVPHDPAARGTRYQPRDQSPSEAYAWPSNHTKGDDRWNE